MTKEEARLEKQRENDAMVAAAVEPLSAEILTLQDVRIRCPTVPSAGVLGGMRRNGWLVIRAHDRKSQREVVCFVRPSLPLWRREPLLDTAVEKLSGLDITLAPPKPESANVPKETFRQGVCWKCQLTNARANRTVPNP